MKKYSGLEIKITDPKAMLRAADLQPTILYISAGETVILQDWKVAAGRKVYFEADVPLLGARHWTAAANLENQGVNIFLGYAPKMTLAPDAPCRPFTVTDSDARVRNERGRETGETLKRGQLVGEISRAGDLVELAALDPQGNQTGLLGYTKAANLTPGFSPFFSGSDWLDERGPYAAWERGEYKGPLVLCGIVGVNGEYEQIALHTLQPYYALCAAAAEAGHTLAIESAFRTYGRQAELFTLWRQGRGNLAARPGSSNHQHGAAFDLNTKGFDTPLYKWMCRNAPRLGFIRTVSGEHWHWEYRPEQAKALAGKFKLPNVRV